MADAVLIVLLVLAVTAAVLLARRALHHWHAERAGRAYELPVDHRATALWTGAAGIAAVVAATLAVPLLRTSTSPAAVPVAARSTPSAASLGEPDFPPPPLRTPQPAPPPPEVRTLGHPSGGTLQVLSDGTRVWMPPFYDAPRAAGVAFPVVLAHVDGPQGDPDLYAGFASAARRGRADQFLLVMPDGCQRDSDVVLAETAQRYRTLTAVTARAVLGIGKQAPCAVQEALTHPGRYSAGVGISGTYPAPARTAGPHPPLLLAVPSAETAPRASAGRLRDALHPRGDAVRLLDGVGDRQEVMSMVAGYLTEKLDAPARFAPLHSTSSSTSAAPPDSLPSTSATSPTGSTPSTGSAVSQASRPPAPSAAPVPAPPPPPHRAPAGAVHPSAHPRPAAPTHPPASPRMPVSERTSSSSPSRRPPAPGHSASPHAHAAMSTAPPKASDSKTSDSKAAKPAKPAIPPPSHLRREQANGEP